MSVTVKLICRDTVNFFCNQFMNILLISLSCALITIIFGYIFSPSESQISFLNEEYNLKNNIALFEIIKNMPLEQQKILWKILLASSFSDIIGNTILVGTTLLMIQIISEGKQINVLQIISRNVLILPKLFILIILTMSLIQIGIILIIIPGVLLAIALSFAPVMLVQERIGILTAMYNSIKLTWYNIRLVAPAVVSWFLAKVILLLLAAHFTAFTLNINLIFLNIVNNLIVIVLLIYMFRLHMLLS